MLAVTMALVFMPIAAMTAPVVTDGEMLVMVDSGNSGALRTLDALGAPVYHRAGARVLAGVNEAGLADLGDSAVLLDRAPWANDTVYYWVTVHGSKDTPLPATVELEVLFRDGGTVLIKARPDEAEKLSLAGHSLAMVTRTHKVLAAPTKSTALSGTRVFGGEIDNMVAAINQLSYTSTLQTLENFGTRYSYAPENNTAGDWIYNRFVSFGLSTERHWFSIGGNQRMNVVATLPGYVYPDEVVFICGHFDCTSEDPYNSAPGADDNGSGTAATIEAARVLSGYTFERTIKFAAWSGEEQGLVGSSAYVAGIAAAGMDVVAVYNLDMIAYSGNDPSPPDLVIYTNSSSLPVANLLSDAILYYVPTQVEPVIDTSALTASDHASFWNHGYQAILGIEDEAWGSDFSPYYHSTSDLVANCDTSYASACTKAGVAATAETAVPFSPTGMRVTPTTGFSAEGPNGGPFTPQTFDYTLTNYENYAINYTVNESSAWLDTSTTGGTIPALGTATVTLSINSAANGLADGGYTANVAFINTTNHDGDTDRTVDLTVGVPVVQYSFDLATNPGWTTQSQWAWGQPTGGGGAYGNPDPTSGHSGPNVYGYNLAGDYPNNLNEAHLTTAAIDCSTLNTVILKFWRYLNVEQPSYDHAYVRVSTDGASWTQVWTNGSEITDAAWSQVEYDISALADGQSTVYIRWTMGDTDGGWTYSGWNIDDVEIWGIDGSSPPIDTVSATLDCLPDSGTLPMMVGMFAALENLTTENRRAAGRIDVVIGNGSSYTSWRAGWTNLSSWEAYTTYWSQNLPALGSLVGDNVFTLVAEDVTPAPYNQPPFAPAGDTDSQGCTVTASAP
jgi:hypothetical protein